MAWFLGAHAWFKQRLEDSVHVEFPLKISHDGSDGSACDLSIQDAGEGESEIQGESRLLIRISF